MLDGENKVQYRRVTTGALQEDGLRVIEEGLKGDERVVVGALQQFRPKQEVKPESVPMPTLGPAPGEAPPSTKSASPAVESRKQASPGSESQKSAPPESEPAKATAPWTGPAKSVFPPAETRKSPQTESGKPASSPTKPAGAR